MRFSLGLVVGLSKSLAFVNGVLVFEHGLGLSAEFKTPVLEVGVISTFVVIKAFLMHLHVGEVEVGIVGLDVAEFEVEGFVGFFNGSAISSIEVEHHI